MTLIPVSKSVASAFIASAKDYSAIRHTIFIWKQFLKEHETTLSETKESSYLLHDYKTVLGILEEEYARLVSSKRLCFVIAKDTQGLIQTLGCYIHRSKPYYEDEAFEITSLLTAPWNIKWPRDLKVMSLKGGGTLIIYAIFISAIKMGTTHISVSSTASSISFYEKLGLRKTSFNRFCLILTDTAYLNHIKEIFEKKLSIQKLDSDAATETSSL